MSLRNKQRMSQPTSLEEELRQIQAQLTRAGGHYIAAYRDKLERERGGVPLALAGVLGAAHKGTRGWFWYLSPEQSRRLQVPRVGEDGTIPEGLQMWAGLYLVNEAGSAVLSQAPEIADFGDGSLLWTIALQRLTLGKRAFWALARIGGVDGLGSLLEEDGLPPEGVGRLTSDEIAQRLLVVALRVSAAEGLQGGTLPLEYPRQVEAPDDRLRRSVAKVSAVGGALAHLAHLVYVAKTYLPL